MHLVLASGSPRRRALLETLGVAFTSSVPNVDESLLEGESPTSYVERVARDKVAAIPAEDGVVLGADTTVVLGGDVLGKPVDGDDARQMLRRLSGRTHLVHTGVAVAVAGLVRSSVSTSKVRLAELTPERISWYVATGEPLDKAGSYALQGLGGVFVESIDGDPFNVIGLPLAPTLALFAEAGLDLLSFRGGP